MSTLGKVLLFVNALLAVGVLYLASQDYAKRRELNNAVLKYQLVIGGQPVDPIADASLGEPAAEQVLVSVAGLNDVSANKLVDRKLVEGLFGGDVPKSQAGLVAEAQDTINKRVDPLPAAGQVRELCGYLDKGRFVPGVLLSMSDTFEERAAIRALTAATADPATSATEARTRLKRRFDAVLAAPVADQPDSVRRQVAELKDKVLANPKDADAKARLAAVAAYGPNGPAASDAQRRMMIAQVLMQASPAPAWQKKVALTVGLKTYQLALAEQTSRLGLMTAQTRDARFADQQSFDAEYEQLHAFSLENSKLLDQQLRVVGGLARMLATDQTLRNQRETQLNNLRAELAQLTAAVNKKLADQKAVEASLFTVQREVGLTLRETGKLENDLRAKELPGK